MYSHLRYLFILLACGCCQTSPEPTPVPPAGAVDDEALRQELAAVKKRLGKLEKAKVPAVEKLPPKDDPFESVDEQGHLIARGFRRQRSDGNYERVGYWKFYWPNGTSRSEGEFVADRESGPWIFFFVDGRKESEGDFVNGLRHGRWTYYWDAAPRIGRVAGLIRHKADHDESGTVVYKIAYYFTPTNTPERESAVVGDREAGDVVHYYTTGGKAAVRHLDKFGRAQTWEMFDKEGNVFAQFTSEGKFFIQDKEVIVYARATQGGVYQNPASLDAWPVAFLKRKQLMGE